MFKQIKDTIRIQLDDKNFIRDFKVFDGANKLISVLTRWKEKGYVVISAYRKEYDTKTNEARQQKLKEEIHAKGYGYVPTLGGYVDIDERSSEQALVPTEESVLVPYNPNVATPEEFLKYFADLAGKYEQETFFYRPPKELQKAGDPDYFYMKPNLDVDMTFNELRERTKEDIYGFTQFKKGNKGTFAAAQVDDAKPKIFFGKQKYYSSYHAYKDMPNKKLLVIKEK